MSAYLSKDGVTLKFTRGVDSEFSKLTEAQIAATANKAIADCMNAMAEVEPKIIGPAVRHATREAIKTIVMPVAKRYVPEDTGDLFNSLKVRAVKYPRRRKKYGHNLVAGSTAQTTGTPFYALFQEFGWRPRSRKTGPFRGDEKRGGKVDHGNLEKYPNAQPFLRPALWSTQAQVLQFVFAKLQEYWRKKTKL